MNKSTQDIIGSSDLQNMHGITPFVMDNTFYSLFSDLDPDIRPLTPMPNGLIQIPYYINDDEIPHNKDDYEILLRDAFHIIKKKFKIDENNLPMVMDSIPELKPGNGKPEYPQKRMIWKKPTFVGHYNSNGDLAYVSLYGMENPLGLRIYNKHDDAINEGYDPGFLDGFLAKYDDEIYVYRKVDYGWYTINSTENEFGYLNMLSKGDINNLNKYLIVHTITANNKQDLPKHINLKEDDITFNKTITGPIKIYDIRYLFTKKFLLPQKYRTFARDIKATSLSNCLKVLYKGLKTPNIVTFDISSLNEDLKDLCQNELPMTDRLTNAPYALSNLLSIFFIHGMWGQGPHYTSLAGNSFPNPFPIEPPFIYSFNPKDQNIDYLMDVCNMMTEMLAEKNLTVSIVAMYQEKYADILEKYGLIEKKELKRRNQIKTIKSKGKILFAELSSIPPVVTKKGIGFPGGQAYHATMREMNNKMGATEAWAEWCYSELEQEHKDDLLKYAKERLNLVIPAGATKADVCKAIIDFKTKDNIEQEQELEQKLALEQLEQEQTAAVTKAEAKATADAGTQSQEQAQPHILPQLQSQTQVGKIPIKLMNTTKVAKTTTAAKAAQTKNQSDLPANSYKCSTTSKYRPNRSYICNPLSGVWIQKDGTTAQKLAKIYGMDVLEEYSNTLR